MVIEALATQAMCQHGHGIRFGHPCREDAVVLVDSVPTCGGHAVRSLRNYLSRGRREKRTLEIVGVRRLEAA